MINRIVCKLGRSIATSICAVLAVTLLCVSVAVLVQALAVLLLIMLMMMLFLPHPLAWYARQLAEAVQIFIFSFLQKDKCPDSPENHSAEE